MKKNKRFILYLMGSINFSLLFAVCFSLSVVAFLDRNAYGEANLAIGIIFFIVSIPFAALGSFAMLAMSRQVNFIYRLQLENSYTLGHRTIFYNFETFKIEAARAVKKGARRNKKSYLLAFTAANASVTANAFHNDMVTSLNYFISERLALISGDRKSKFSSRNTVYGFNRGIFLVLINTNDEVVVTDFINTTTQDIFDIVEQHNIRLMVQPFFGIKEVEKTENIVGAIEDTMIARSVSESNFESYTFFDKSFKNESTNQDFNEIEEALNNNEFVVYYQPKYSIREKRFISSEALARWDSPKYGLLSPSAFINKAENAGLISTLDNYIFEKALEDLSEALKRGRRVLPVSVNFSLYEFYSHKFLDNVVALLQKYRVPPSLIEIEITETTSQANQFLSVSVIKKLKDIGIRVLMDDFGVGYSGIENLRNIPFDAIKIDKSFTDLILTDEKTRSIVKLLADLGHLNDIEVIIEGVDNKEQVDMLRKMRVDTIQGFYYARPMSEADYEIFLKTNAFEKEKK